MSDKPAVLIEAMQPVEGIGDACREHNCLFLLDTVIRFCKLSGDGCQWTFDELPLLFSRALLPVDKDCRSFSPKVDSN